MDHGYINKYLVLEIEHFVARRVEGVPSCVTEIKSDLKWATILCQSIVEILVGWDSIGEQSVQSPPSMDRSFLLVHKGNERKKPDH